jgi:hypothetical protein
VARRKQQQRVKRLARREVNRDLQTYVRVTKRLSSAARQEGYGLLADELDQRVADAILGLPKSEKVRVAEREEAAE